LELARTHPVDLITLDVHMSPVDGRDVAHRLRADAATWDIPHLPKPKALASSWLFALVDTMLVDSVASVACPLRIADQPGTGRSWRSPEIAPGKQFHG
jgi:hypothetical protein